MRRRGAYAKGAAKREEILAVALESRSEERMQEGDQS